MKLLINLFIISLFPFFLTNGAKNANRQASASLAIADTNTAATDAEPYCNTRFGFCLEYPTTLLTNKVEGENEDGIELYNEAGTFQVAAYGSFDLFNWDAQEIYDFNMKSIAHGDSEIIVFSQTIDADHYATDFLYKGYIHHQEVWLSADYYLTLNISVPEGQKEWLEMLRETVKLTIKA